jgi:hypothetical protein
MTLSEIERAIAEARTESLACAIVGDNAGALDAHNLAAELAQQRDAARHMEIVVSEK